MFIISHSINKQTIMLVFAYVIKYIFSIFCFDVKTV